MEENVVTVPNKIDTLRDKAECPECGTPMEKGDPICDMCGYEMPPEGFQDPDLDKAKEFDRKQKKDRDTEAPEEDEPKKKIKRPRRPSFANKKQAYWIDGYYAVIWHPKLGFGVATNQSESHLSVVKRMMEGLDPEDPIFAGVYPPSERIVHEVYSESYRAIYHPGRQILAHAAGPDDFLATMTQVVPNNSSSDWRYFWAEKAREQNLPVKEYGIMRIMGNKFVVDTTSDTEESFIPYGEREGLGGEFLERPDSYYGTDPDYEPASDLAFIRQRMEERIPGYDRYIAPGRRRGKVNSLKEVYERIASIREKLQNQGNNKQMDIKPIITLKAHTRIPSAERLASMGWDVLIKEAGPNPKDKNEKALVEDGKKATNEPSNVKVISDQRKPVESRKKAERVIRREEIIETDDDNEKEDEQETRQDLHRNPYATSAKKAADEDVKEEENEEVDSEDNEEEAEMRRVEVPVLRASKEQRLLAALKLADLEAELGLDSNWTVEDKYARAAELEAQSLGVITAQTNTLKAVKEAKILNTPKRIASGNLPSFRVAKAASNGHVEVEAVPDGYDEQVFS